MKYAYKKALRVIDSCENMLQLRGARNYVNNFFKFYASGKGEKLGPFSLLEADVALSDTYTRLLTFLEIKEKNIRKGWKSE